ncbi:MAG TPA: DUF2089 domain-containing protein [Anaerolineae bacterium]|nr:DUF2089 domain-containing protein [Anaerolineae bacterium]
MNKLLWRCPVCDQELSVTGLECGSCGTEIHGHFGLGRFARLGSDDLHFIEIFVKTRGNAYRVAEELEIPYSSVRARLTEIIRALGYESEPEPREEIGPSPERRRAILDDLSKGKLTSEQAVKLLQGEAV